MISQTTIDQVKELDIVEVISKYVELKKAGPSWRACSPFSNEKTPSFYVVPAKGIYKCFSSGNGGDHIGFVMAKFSLQYIDAIKKICADFSIPVKYDDSQPKEYYEERDLLYKVNHAVTLRYVAELRSRILAWPIPDPLIDTEDDDLARKAVYHELFEKRKFTLDTIIQWQIGYAPGKVTAAYTPEKWNFLSKVMVGTGYYKQGIDLGLIKTKNDVNYDAFRNRIIYPILDHNGKYVGFGARSLDSHIKEKYLNSSESKIFNKSHVLYGLHFAGAAIRQLKYVYLVEGYCDVISLHQAGLTNTVGTNGTALTEEQCKLLKKYTNKVVIFSEDEAAANAALRSIDLLMQHGFMTSVVPMPSMLTLKPEPPTEEKPDPEQFKNLVFITQRDKDTLKYKYGNDILEVPFDKIESIGKIDPDELVRLLNSNAVTDAA